MQKSYYLVFINLVFILISCNSGGDTNTPKIMWNSCEIVTKADAEKFLSTSVKEPVFSNSGEKNDRPYMSNCSYIPSNVGSSMESLGILVRLAQVSENAKDAPQRFAESFNKQFANIAMEPIPNLGDGAFWTPSLGQLTIFRGADMIILSATLSDPAKRRESLEILAKDVLSRLKF